MARERSLTKPSRAPQVSRRTGTAARSQQILSAAFQEFAANGYEATRLDDVARRAQIAKGTIYLHFAGKEVLLRAVVRELIRPVFEGFDEVGKDFSGRYADRIGELLSRMYAEVVRNERARCVLRLLIAESGRFPELSRAYREEVVEPGMAAMRGALERGVAAGEFEQRKVVDFPQILVAPAVLAVVWMLIFGDRQALDLDAYFQAHLEMVMAGLRKVSAAGTARGGEATP
jgi:AcrR family transcriptional regulator